VTKHGTTLSAKISSQLTTQFHKITLYISDAHFDNICIITRRLYVTPQVCLHNRLARTTGDSITGSATRYEVAVSLLMLSTSIDGTVICYSCILAKMNGIRQRATGFRVIWRLPKCQDLLSLLTYLLVPSFRGIDDNFDPAK